MPPRLIEYGARDWVRLRPLLHRSKTMRYRAQDQRFRRLPPASGDTRELGFRVKGSRVLFSIAFGDAKMIARQASLVKLYVKDALYIVVDNTRDDASAAAVQEVARGLDVP